MKRLIAGMFAALIGAGTFAPAAAIAKPVRADAQLYALAARYLDDNWRLNPAQATNVGVHAYDSQLGDFSAAGFRARIGMEKKYLTLLHAVPKASLSTEAGYDYQIFESRMQASLLTLETEQNWRHHPSLYTGAAANAIYALLKRQFAAPEVQMRAALSRMKAVPAMLDDALPNITTVDPVTAQIEAADIKGSMTFLGPATPMFENVKDPALQAQFKAAREEAVSAIERFSGKLAAGPFAHPSGTFAIGPKDFAERLRLQELSPITLAQYESVGMKALAETKAQFIATARKIDPSKTPQEVATLLGADHPSADALIPTAQKDLIALRAFVAAHHLVTLPRDYNIKVVPTPVFARQTTFASMDAPGPLERIATQAYYNVTPVEPDWSDARKEQHLAFFNNSYRPIVSAHEVMPGHYLNFIIANKESLSNIRKVFASPSYSEGWAHYDEQMMVDEGWGNGDPKVRLAQLQGALLREARYLVGLREHTRGMTVDQATQFFMDNTFTGQEPSHREALRGTQDPLYGYYTLGKLELLKLRSDYKKKIGAAYTLQKFHDAYLAHGKPPIAIVRKELLGSSDDGKLL